MNRTAGKLYLRCWTGGPDNRPVLLLLHGFLGQASEWRWLAEILRNDMRPLAVDLPGHGRAHDFPLEADGTAFDHSIDALEVCFKRAGLERIVLAGYSLGGRLALAYALRYPQRVKGLILASASAGISANTVREQRLWQDRLWAERFRHQTLDTVLQEWYRQPLFKSLTHRITLDELIRRRQQNSATALARAIEAFSPGLQPDYHAQLANLQMPVLLLAGEKDKKYVRSNHNLAQLNPRFRHLVIGYCGHAIHIEQPAAFAMLVKAFVSSLA